MDTQEQWRPSPLAPPHVEVSNLGRVRVLDRLAESSVAGRPAQLRYGRVLSPYVGRQGYQVVAVKVGPKRTKFLVHRLVAAAFCENFDPQLSVNHINCIKVDNRAGNLEWVTLKKNSELQWRDGLVNLRGEAHPGSKLTADQVRHVRKALAAGANAPTISRMLNVSASLIYKIGSGLRWRE